MDPAGGGFGSEVALVGVEEGFEGGAADVGFGVGAETLGFEAPEDGEPEGGVPGIGEDCGDFVEGADFGDAGPGGEVLGGLGGWFGGFLVGDSCIKKVVLVLWEKKRRRIIGLFGKRRGDPTRECGSEIDGDGKNWLGGNCH